MKAKFKIVSKRHLKKLDKFWKIKAEMGNELKPSMYIKHTANYFSSYVLSGKEYNALSYGLDHHIPTSSNYNTLELNLNCFINVFIKYFTHS